MFIDPDDPDQLPSSVGAKHLVAEEHISLLRSEAVLFQLRVYKHFAALRRRQDLCLELLASIWQKGRDICKIQLAATGRRRACQ